MGKLLKKGHSGTAKDYITRTRAVRKLQISLADFRRLCILKGVYPRNPKNKNKIAGSGNGNNTFYYVKDIQHLTHEPLLQKFREHHAFMNKITRALGKRQMDNVKSLQESTPTYTLHHLVKERYPSFIDAIRDLDDCLSHVFLFASLPATYRLTPHLIKASQKLAAEFLNYVVVSKSLRKTFLSIKGIYYQAQIKGQLVTWVVPYQFNMTVPRDVDLRVMLTFLEFYHTMLGFVNYKLYGEKGLKYPPSVSPHLDENGAGWMTSFMVETLNTERAVVDSVLGEAVSQVGVGKAAKKIDDSVMSRIVKAQNERDQNGGDEMTTDQQEEAEQQDTPLNSTDNNLSQQPATDIFKNKVVLLSREVPRYSLEFVLKSFGAVVCWPETSGAGSPMTEDDDRITHVVVDRPLESLSLRANRVYIQPQWVYDSINSGALLEESLYAPGKQLPPHLSPFMNYDPNHGLDGDELENEEEGTAAATTTADIDPSQIELEAEAKGVTFSEFDNQTLVEKAATKSRLAQTKAAAKRESEKTEMAKMLLSNKKRKLLDRIQLKESQQMDKNRELALKKKAASKQKSK